jgi:hypothetical protein
MKKKFSELSSEERKNIPPPPPSKTKNSRRIFQDPKNTIIKITGVDHYFKNKYQIKRQ